MEQQAQDASVNAQLDDIIAQLRTYHPAPDIDKLKAAFEFAHAHHAGQTRRSGEPYISHPVAVASIVTELNISDERRARVKLAQVKVTSPALGAVSPRVVAAAPPSLDMPELDIG